MYQVVVIPPPEVLGEIEPFRRLHDPAFHRIPAHVALVPPFEALRRDNLERLVEMGAGPPVTLALGEPVAEGHTLSLPVTDGRAELEALREIVSGALLDPAADVADTPPALRVGLISVPAELELARRALAAATPPAAFDADCLVLLLEDVRGLWHPTRELPLR